MKDWHKLKPKLFKKQPYYLPGCDIAIVSRHHRRGAAALDLWQTTEDERHLTSGIGGRVRQWAANDFVRGVGLLAGGAIAGQAIMVLVLPVLTRLYDPADFGILGVYMSLLTVLSVAACLRLDIATPLPKDDADAVNLVILGVLAASIFAAVLGVVVTLTSDTIIQLIHQPRMRAYLWMLPIGSWLAAVYSAIQLWSIRKKRYGMVAQAQLVRAIGGAGSQTALGFVNPSPFGLLAGYMLYIGLGSLRLVFTFWKHDRKIAKEVSIHSLWRNLRAQWRFPLFSVPESLLNSAANNLPIILIAVVAGKGEAGFMLLAERVTSIPTGLLGSSISRVYLSQAQEKLKEGLLEAFTRKIMRNLFFAGIIPFVGLALLAPFAFPFVFGEAWLRAGVMVSWMVPFMMLRFIVAPVSTILHATQNQLVALVLQLFGFILLIGSIFLASHIDIHRAFEFFAMASVIYYATYLAVILYISRCKEGTSINCT